LSTTEYFPNSGVEATPEAGRSSLSEEGETKVPQGPVFHPPLAAHVVFAVVCQIGAGGVVVEEAGAEVVFSGGLISTLLSVLGAADDAGVAVWTRTVGP